MFSILSKIFPQINLAKIGLVVVGAGIVLALGYFTIHSYGESQYTAGQLAQKSVDEQSVIKQMQVNTEKLNAAYDASVKAADAAHAASDAMASGLATINAKYKGQTTTIIKQGVCLPSPSFTANWNALSTYSQQGK